MFLLLETTLFFHFMVNLSSIFSYSLQDKWQELLNKHFFLTVLYISSCFPALEAGTAVASSTNSSQQTQTNLRFPLWFIVLLQLLAMLFPVSHLTITTVGEVIFKERVTKSNPLLRIYWFIGFFFRDILFFDLVSFLYAYQQYRWCTFLILSFFHCFWSGCLPELL